MTEQNPSPAASDEHAELDDVMAQLLAALQRRDSDVLFLWRQFERRVQAHMDQEEQDVIPRLAALRLREALVLQQEHAYLRTRLAEIGDSLLRGTIRFETARSFRDELRAHERHETAILARLARDG